MTGSQEAKGGNPMLNPFNLGRWIDANAPLLKPPVSNKLLFE
jgi:hypothetical protein